MEIRDLEPIKDPKGGASDTQEPFHSPRQININTGVSIGLIVLLCAGIWSILTAINSTKSEITSTKNDLSSNIKDLTTRVESLEKSKNSWTSVQMFQWAVHLQQLNSDPKKLQTDGLKVPEPEVQTK